MLRSPLVVLKEHRWQTTAVVVALAAVLWLSAAVAAGIYQAHAAAEGWFDQFAPVIYFDSGVDETQLIAIRAEIEQWSTVSDVRLERPDETLEHVEQHLGASQVEQLALTDRMMPSRLTVDPVLWAPGQVELIARLEALEEREAVVAVDVPAADALDWLENGRMVAGGIAVAVLGGLVAALVVLGIFLRTLAGHRRKEKHLLEVFGASRLSLKLPTLWRGVFVGAAAGIVAAVGFVPWSLTFNDFIAEIAGAGAMPPLTSALWACVLVPLGAMMGAVVGWIAAAPPRSSDDEAMESLLEWEK